MSGPLAVILGHAAIILRLADCDQGPISMDTVPHGDRHGSRCLKWSEIDWDAPLELAEQKVKAEPGRVVLNIENLKKYYEVAANALFGGWQ